MRRDGDINPCCPSCVVRYTPFDVTHRSGQNRQALVLYVRPDSCQWSARDRLLPLVRPRSTSGTVRDGATGERTAVEHP